MAAGGIARPLHDGVERREALSADSTDEGQDEDETDLIDGMLRFNEIRPRFEAATERFGLAWGRSA